MEPHEAPGRTPEESALAIWHFDFYRFSDPREWEEAGFRDLFASDGLKLAEWPEKAAGVLPVADVDIELTVRTDDSRLVLCHAKTPAGVALLQVEHGAGDLRAHARAGREDEAGDPDLAAHAGEAEGLAVLVLQGEVRDLKQHRRRLRDVAHERAGAGDDQQQQADAEVPGIADELALQPAAALARRPHVGVCPHQSTSTSATSAAIRAGR